MKPTVTQLTLQVEILIKPAATLNVRCEESMLPIFQERMR